MRSKHIYISLFAMVFFAAPLAWQYLFGLDVSPIGLLLKLPIFLIVALVFLWLIDKHTKADLFSMTFESQEPWLKTIATAFLLLAILYLLKSIGNMTYLKWLDQTESNPEIIGTLSYIVSKPVLGSLLIGPFVWLNVLFIEGSRAYFHSHLESQQSKKWMLVVSLFIIPFVLSSTQLNSSYPQFIGTFISNLVLSIAFIRLHDLKPLVISSILYQSIDLIAFWIYS
ncbi:MAG: hypothetical protein RIB79_07130 [Allomuricauda sp.]